MDQDSSLPALLTATAGGDEKAFAALYNATRGKLFGVILRILSRRDWAEDVLQEAYVKIWRSAADYRPDKGAPITWMTAIARNSAIDRRRRERGELPLDAVADRDEWPDPEPSPLDWAIAGAEARRLMACLDELEAPQRDCIVMAMCEGYTHQELAERLDTPLGTIKSWIRRSLARLKDCLER